MGIWGARARSVVLGPAFAEVAGDLTQFSWRWERVLFLLAVRDALPRVIAEGQEQKAPFKTT